MTSEVLDIHALSPYDVTPQQTHDASPHSTSSLSLASNRQSAAMGESDVTWKLEEATLSRNTGAVLRKDQESEDLEAVPRASTTTADTKEGEKDWHPLREGSADHTQEATVVVDLGESLLDANGRLRYTDHMDSAKSTPSPSPRNSHIKGQVAPSPPPWEVIGPPSNNGHREYGGGAKVIRPSQSRRLVPKSSYYFGPPPADSAFGTMPVGHIGQHHPREVIRVERDYTGGELIQFAPIYPLELEGRITPTKFLESINAINERLIEAHSMKMSALDNVLAIVTLYLSRLIITSHYDKEIERLKDLFAQLNRDLYNPAGLNLLWPGDIAFLFMEIEYY